MGKITYKIDRLVSLNDTLELGLKTGVTLKAIKANQSTPTLLESAAILKYTTYDSNDISYGASNSNNAFQLSSSSRFYSGPNEDVTDALKLVPNVAFVQGYAKNQKNIIYHHLFNNYIKKGQAGVNDSATSAHLDISYGGSETNPSVYLRVSPLYNANENIQTATIDGTQTTIVGTNGSANLTVGSMDASAHNFITGFTTDEYGKITGVQTKAVSTADMNFDGATLDNYRSWAVDIVGGSQGGPFYVTSAYATHDATTATGNPNFVFAGTNGLVPQMGTAIVGNNVTIPKVTYNLNFDNTSFEYDSTVGGLNQFALKTIEGVETTTASLLNIAVDTKGRITAKSAVDSTQITNLVAEFASNQKGIVKPQDGTNTVTAVGEGNNSPTYFLTSSGGWATLPIAKVQVAELSSNNTTYPLLASADAVSGTANHTAVAASAVYLTGAGKLHATSFDGDGSSITNIDVNNLYGGSGGTNKIDASLINISGNISGKTNLITELGLTGIRANTTGHYAANKVIITDNTGALTTTNAKINGVDAAGTAVLAAEYDASGNIRSDIAIQWKSLKALVTGIVAGEGGMRFMGVLGDGTNGTITWAAAEGSFKKGDFYKVGATSGVSYGPLTGKVETGDTVFAVVDKPNTYDSANTDDKAACWTVIQANLQNALTYDSTALASNSTYKLPLLDDTHYKVQSGFNITTNGDGTEYTLANAIVPKAEKLKTGRSLWGYTFDGSADIPGGTGLTGVGTILPHANATENSGYNLGSSDIHWKEAWINTIHGKADTAGTADNTVGTLSVYSGAKVEGSTPIATFNGSANTDLILNWDSMNVFDTISNVLDNSANTGNVVTGITLSRSDADHSTLVCTVQKGITAVTNVSSSIFAISGTTERTISFFNSNPTDNALAFYTGGNAPTSTTVLKLNGILHAAGLKVTSGTSVVDVALKTTAAPTNGTLNNSNRPLLVADNDVNGTNYYGFTSSSIYVSSNDLTVAGNYDNATVPTTQAVNNAITKVTNAVSASTKVEVLKVSFTGSDGSYSCTQASAIPENSIVEHVDVYINSAFGENVHFKLVPASHASDNGFIVVNHDEIDLTETGTCFSYKISKAITTMANDKFLPTVVISGTTNGDTGAGTCYIYYTKTQLS